MPNDNGKNNNVSYEAKDIYVLEGLEPVRKRPGMYIGSTGVDGLHHLVWEVVDNSLDEAMAGFANEIEIALLPQNRVKVQDNGRGIPVDIHKQTKKSALETVMCTLHAGGKFGGESYKVSGGLHGVGVSVVNALSVWLRVEVCRDGYLYFQEYNRGKPKASVKKVGKCGNRGTTVYFEPDAEIFKEINFNWDTILNHLRQQAYLDKAVKITIRDLRSVQAPPESFFGVCQPSAKAKNKIGKEPKGDNGERSYSFFFEGGIISYVKFLNDNEEASHPNIFYVNREVENIQVEVALQYTKDIQGYEMSFANNIYTAEGGMHLTGFRTALTRSLNDYARKNGYLKNSDENLTGDDVREGLTAVVSLKLREPQFEGQTKAKLGNPEARTAVETAVSYGLEEYLEKNPNDAREILGRCILASKARQAAKAAKDTVLRKGILDGLALPGKLADCSSRNPAESELFIVEGDSAGGCLAGDTKIALTDGRNITFKELAKEYKEGKRNYCYTIKRDGKVGIALVENPRRTRIKARVFKMILDNNEEIICTPGHKFMLRDRTYKEARRLTKDDSLMPLYRQYSKIGKRITIEGYEMIFSPTENRWIFTHLLADQFNIDENIYSEAVGPYRHHKDFNKLNNSPENVNRLTKEDHLKIHQEMAAKTLSRPDVLKKLEEIRRSTEYRQKISQKMSSPGMKKMLSKRAKKQWQDEDYKNYMAGRFLEFYNSNSKYREKNKKLLLEAQKEYWSSDKNKEKQAIKVRKYFEKHPEMKVWLSGIARKQWSDVSLRKWRSEMTKKQWTQEFRRERKEAYSQTYLRKALEALFGIYQKDKIINKETYNRVRKSKNDKSLIKYETICNRFFDGSEKRLREAVMNFNHRVKDIIPLTERIDVYDLEVSGTHNFALSSGIFVHNSAKQGRDRNFQAILPLRGKILNVEKARLDKALTSKEVKALIIAMGTAIADSFDISKLRYHRIIIMTDADVDGAHIRTLLLTLFFRYFIQLIEAGHIYIAQPPLYRLARGKEIRYVYSDAEKETVLAELKKKKDDKAAKAALGAAFAAKKTAKEKAAEDGAPEEGGEKISGSAELTDSRAERGGVNIQRYKGLGEMNPEQLWETTMDPKNRVLKQVTIEDAKEADKIFDILMGDEVAPRKRFIQTHAKKVKNLDI